MQRLQFESSPLFILLCLAAGLGYAAILYSRSKHSWSNAVNWLLFSLRAVVVSFAALLLLGMIMKFTTNITEKPSYVFLVDNSSSIEEVLDSVKLQKLATEIGSASQTIQSNGYDVALKDLSGTEFTANSKNNYKSSDLTTAIKKITDEYEGRNLAGIILVSDGIYNSGISPLFTSFRVPIHTVAIGDSASRADIALKNLAFNKIAYQGNKFPLKAEVLAQGLPNKELTVSIYQSGKKVASLSKSTSKNSLLEFDMQLQATEKGLQRIDVVLEPVSGETNLKNNRASAFIEVVAGKKKILVVAPAPHPDIKALRAVIEKNDNYEFLLFIPGVAKVDDKSLQLNQADLIIFHQVLDNRSQTRELFTKLIKGSSGVLNIIGQQSSLIQFQANGLPFKFENIAQRDEVTPSLNNLFRDFTFSDNVAAPISRYPPISVPLGKFSYPSNASILMYQRIGSIVTDRPLIFTYEDNGRKMGAIVGEGFWKWRLNEYSETERTGSFDEVFSKLIQYLSTREDKRRFRSFPVLNEFDEADPILFESQVYNELFEPVYGNAIQLDIINEQGVTTTYNYITSKDGLRYRIGGLKEGVYKYKASTQLNGKNEEVRGDFLVNTKNIETQNLTADFALLKKLADNTGGKSYSSNEIEKLVTDIEKSKVASIIHSEDSFKPLINLKWVFFLLLVLVSAEWFLRKYLGSY